MRDRWSGCANSGCVIFVAGLVAGASLAILALVVWAMVHPVDRTPLENRFVPGGSDLEVAMSEAFLNEAVAQELAERDVGDLVRIIMDARPGWKLDATLEGQFDLGGLYPPALKVDAECALGVEGGWLVVRIERIGVGPVFIDRDALPMLVEPLVHTAEETMEFVVNERLREEGFEVREVRSDEVSLTLGLRER